MDRETDVQTATPLLLLDDDGAYRGLVADELRGAGFHPVEVATVAEAEAIILHGPVRFEALMLAEASGQGSG